MKITENKFYPFKINAIISNTYYKDVNYILVEESNLEIAKTKLESYDFECINEIGYYVPMLNDFTVSTFKHFNENTNILIMYKNGEVKEK